jgi:ubiquinone/menaquinone biosynthesis C-methylase UbiE
MERMRRLLTEMQRVLDVGTGTGIWAIDFADEYPNTAVLGTDLSPIQPSMVPPNCRFEIDDARDEWTYPNDYFDFVHIRSLFGSIGDWNELYKQAYT